MRMCRHYCVFQLFEAVAERDVTIVAGVGAYSKGTRRGACRGIFQSNETFCRISFFVFFFFSLKRQAEKWDDEGNK